MIIDDLINMIKIYPDYPVNPVKKMEIPILLNYEKSGNCKNLQ
jgi:hypothetical protein